MDQVRQELFANFARVTEAARHLFEQKSSAYGYRNIAESGEDGVLLRMKDKFARISNKDIPGESVEDTLIDLMNYAAILLLLRSGKWPGYQAGTAQRDLGRALQVLDSGAAGISAPALEGDVGYDLRAARDVTAQAGLTGPTYIPTGVRVKAPEGTWIRIVGRSSTTKLGLLTAEGVIDNAYTGELLVACFNLSGRDITVRAGDRLAQLICCPIITPKMAIVEQLPVTARGSKGFGSTGEAVSSSAPPVIAAVGA
ncbi:dUTP diphosphatase [Sorangium sp. So ce341]|uniref:dUTP diphosphatase n=1 Tax=Sorangium sp. So ce341 TaxID=3133302 RepID=UPI003F6139F1